MKKEGHSEVEDYPLLKAWLTEREAACMWICKDGRRHVQAWLVRGAIVLVLLYPDRVGFDVYTNLSTSNMAALKDADARIDAR